MKRMMIALLALTALMTVHAQSYEVPNSSSRKKFVNMNLGGLMGSAIYSHLVNGEGYKFKDVHTMGGFVEFDWVLNGMRTELELDYQTADLEERTTNVLGTPPFNYNTAEFADNLKIYTAMAYIGYTGGAGKRFQVPLMVGLGVDHIEGYPQKSTNFALGAKVRAVIYLTKNVGLFAGYRYKLTSRDKKGSKVEGLSENDKLDITNNYHNLEVGLTMMLGRMGGNKQ